MNMMKRAAVVVAGISMASASWATFTLTRKGVRTSLDAAFFYTPFELGIPYEQVTFYNSEGLKLRGWLLTARDTTKVVITCPGYGRSKSDLLGVGARLLAAGYSVLLFDFRDQGESDPAISTIGHYERDDLDAAIDYVLWRIPGAQIALLGYSMGASAAIMSAAARPEVLCVISDSAFADLRRILRRTFRQLTHMPPSPAVDIAEMLIWLRAGYRFSKVRPIDEVGKLAPRPILFIHGTADVVTPVEDAYALYAAAGEPKELWIEEGCAHCGAYFADRQVYVNRLLAFLGDALGAPDAHPVKEAGAGLHIVPQQGVQMAG